VPLTALNESSTPVPVAARSKAYVFDHSPAEIVGSNPVAYPGILFGEGSTNSAEDRGQREGGSWGSSPLVRGSGARCNLVFRGGG
jgi:hypothetical protein